MLLPVTAISTRGWSLRDPAMRPGQILADGLVGGDGEAVQRCSGGCGDGFACFLSEHCELIRVGKQGFAGSGRATLPPLRSKRLRRVPIEGLDLSGHGGLGEQEILRKPAESRCRLTARKTRRRKISIPIRVLLAEN